MTINQVTQKDHGARPRVIELGLDVHASLIVVARPVDEQASQPPQRSSEEAFIGFANRQYAQVELIEQIETRSAPAHIRLTGCFAIDGFQQHDLD